jgi:putative hydrolase of the HAD superfamily
MSLNLTTIGFDADDTLWQNEQFFRLTEARFAAMLGDHGEAAEISAACSRPKGATSPSTASASRDLLSMIETAIEVTQGAGCRRGHRARFSMPAARC